MCLCTFVCVWGRRISIYTQWFRLEQVREDGGTSTQAIKKLVIKRFKILGSQKEISAPAPPPQQYPLDDCVQIHQVVLVSQESPRTETESQSQSPSQDKKSGRGYLGWGFSGWMYIRIIRGVFKTHGWVHSSEILCLGTWHLLWVSKLPG